MKTALARALDKHVLRGDGSFAHEGLFHRAGTEAPGANADGAHTTGGVLVTDALQVRIKAAFGLDIGMAHKVAGLGLFAANFALFRHDNPP
jgi:hypothetical protein